ncbi:MAG TPA: methyltransferase domain-containing protein [Anaerolineales bacterium]|nr:methyltransferase domain-containing protein [Anaerolineales bacterium]
MSYTKSAPWYDIVYSFKDYAGEVDKLRALLEARARRPLRRVLDVACGTGEHLRFLQAFYDVEGLDLNEAMLEVARAKLPGVTLHHADMLDFDLGRRFDAVVCLFSAVGYLRTDEELTAGVANMARHLGPGGVLAVEPWLTPDAFQSDTLHGLYVDRPEVKLARMTKSYVEGRVSVMDMHHLVNTARGVEYFVERHELTLFRPEEYAQAFQAAGLESDVDSYGLIGRGLYLGRRPEGESAT